MIIVKLQGGLGNQMFQYAYGKRVAMALKSELKLDLITLLDRSHNHYTHRDFELDVFELKASKASPKEIASFFNPSMYTKALCMVGLTKYKHYTEPHFGYFPVSFNRNPNIYLNGYWQSEKYFSLIENELREDFRFKIPANEKNQQILEEICSVNSVSIHIRRGDYITLPSASEFHEVCTLDYYSQSIAHIVKNVSNPFFYVFSDDIQWVSDNLKIPFPSQIISHNQGKNSYEDLRLMSACKHQIIANSSFSWWGAWLNQNKNKIVIAPKSWFKDKSIDTSDLIPSGWIRL